MSFDCDDTEFETQMSENYYHSLAISNFNAIVVLADTLSRSGVLTEEALGSLHCAMSKPLAIAENADNVLVAAHQETVDKTFAMLLQVARVSKPRVRTDRWRASD